MGLLEEKGRADQGDNVSCRKLASRITAGLELYW